MERLATAPKRMWSHWLRENATFWLTETTFPTRPTISPNKPKQLDDGYLYAPTSPTKATFDAFFYATRSRTATVFQCTDGKEHDVNSGGPEFLGKLCVENVVYVGVIPPRRNTSFEMHLDGPPLIEPRQGALCSRVPM
ncbi:hypothetical protein BV22DRAFT_1037885 [Leucogyrophana mollusca]|uniref:Uncharacterized protein n=1 Tax=Leucogyrophana mollusca TaxID=85980 RepID=A0ACB8B8E9_9AGAM|nr:hypothetical protein BV22DRAFT_1037885 [Leucogyrophana mollusca]